MSTAMESAAGFDACAGLRRLARAELPVDTVKMARYLIGKVIVHDTTKGRLCGRIVETEAYPVGDEAGHAFRGRTPRNGALFLERGHAYVYLAYGLSILLNVSSENAGVGAGVLLRAIELPDGKGREYGGRQSKEWTDAGKGPGRLTKALKVNLRHNGVDLCGANSLLWLAAIKRSCGAIGKSVRIGLTHGTSDLLRFFERDSGFISGPRRLLRE